MTECCMAHLISKSVGDFQESTPHAYPQPDLIRRDEWNRVQGWIICDLGRMVLKVGYAIDARNDDTTEQRVSDDHGKRVAG